MPHIPEPRSRPVYTPPGGPAPSPKPSPQIFAAMGQANIFLMLEDFYSRLPSSPIARLFPQNPDELVAAAHKSAAFFVGLFGGPPLYHQLHGPPMLRARHVPFEIDDHARLVWLRCFNETLDSATERFNFPAQHLPAFRAFLDTFSRWMVNVAPPSDDNPDAPPSAPSSISLL